MYCWNMWKEKTIKRVWKAASSNYRAFVFCTRRKDNLSLVMQWRSSWICESIDFFLSEYAEVKFCSCPSHLFLILLPKVMIVRSDCGTWTAKRAYKKLPPTARNLTSLYLTLPSIPPNPTLPVVVQTPWPKYLSEGGVEHLGAAIFIISERMA